MLYLLKTISYFTRLIPRNTLLLFGKTFGFFAYYFFPFRKKVALINIKIAFNEESNSFHKNILKKTYIHFGMVMMDFLRTRHFNPNYIKKIIKIDNRTSIDLNSKIILTTGHIGSWEMILPIMGSNKNNFSVVTQPQKNNGSNIFFDWVRKYDYVKLIPKGDSINKMQQVLDNNHILGLAVDQNAGKHGIEIPFFNKNVSMPKGAGIFHNKTNAPVLVGFCILLNDLTYKLIIEEIIIKSKEEAIYNINKKFNEMLERKIINNPEQYFWFHRRFPRSIYH
tara:strand:- start:48 stop:887 length:840 start_codon:yes stop_codon:yes gene_type:complete